MQLLTTSEAAAYLRLKERKIYEMVAEGAVPCTKVTGRWLFPKAELDHWLAASVLRPAGVVRPEPAPIISGSHDPLLEWAFALRQHDYFKPSMQTLFNFLRSEQFATRAGEFGGYDLGIVGMVRFVSR